MTRKPRVQEHRTPRSREDLERALGHQYELLVDDCAAFDAGKRYRSRTLAVSARVLVHTTMSSRSLLDQLNLIRGIRFVDTRLNPEPGVLILSEQGLACNRITMTATASTSTASSSWDAVGDGHAGRVNPPMPFRDWWNDKVIEASKGDWWSRGRLVLAMANTDGGAHVDPALDPEYVALLDDRLGMLNHVGDEEVPFPAYAWAEANMRQIAHELVRTLQRDWRTAPLVGDPADYRAPLSP
ncbi:MAG: hypothetical protein JO246_01045 [Frankiaceae bacterium]|nr:hypothetical protein [Frankiaceae bacterium]MBV9871846.1 hypothetical protein [Frankiaceae bacterium]